MPADIQFQQRVQRITAMVEQVDSLADPAARAAVRDLLVAITEMHGAGLERVMEILVTRGREGQAVIEQLSSDPLLAPLLILHGLHPQDFETRVRSAFERVASSVRSQGGTLEFVAIEDGAVKLRLECNGHGCGASALRTLVEDAMYAAAPDLSSLSIEGATHGGASTIVPLEKLVNASMPGVIAGAQPTPIQPVRTK
jgi:Fe-S cluster biogenesis protein NfuA